MSTGWLLRPGPRVQPRVRLFCFPHAGVGASVYRLWPKGFSDEVEVCAIQAPGREYRLREPPLASLPDLVAALLPAIEPLLDLPFAFFGHSLGAVFAVEVARALNERGNSRPGHLFVSARRPPHLPDPQAPLHALPDEDFVAEINRRYGGIPPEVLRERELMALLLPSLRADMTALETHRPPERPPLPVPISVFGGADDRITPREHLDAWRGETSGAFRVRVFPGGHFYLVDRRAELLADLAQTLAPLATTGSGQLTA
jgi:medium-chain acyl-[acyl-carrier-protein] hydrolase